MTTDEIAALRALTVPELAARYTEAFGKPPRVRHKAWLVKRLAWRAETGRSGGLSNVARRTLEALIAEIQLPLDEPAGPPAASRQESRPRPGTVLMREWRGRQIRVSVLERGFEQDGTVYRSLSAVAKAVTGAHWNGRLFFGLARRAGA